jgi:hypothetical protein
MGLPFGWLSPIAANYVVVWCIPAPQKKDTWMANLRRDDFPNNFAATWSRPRSTGSSCRRHPAPMATTTSRPDGRSARSGAAAVMTTRSGDATVPLP